MLSGESSANNRRTRAVLRGADGRRHRHLIDGADARVGRRLRRRQRAKVQPKYEHINKTFIYSGPHLFRSTVNPV